MGVRGWLVVWRGLGLGSELRDFIFDFWFRIWKCYCVVGSESRVVVSGAERFREGATGMLRADENDVCLVVEGGRCFCERY